MKRAKKEAAKKAAKKSAAPALPDKLYRPFEKLAKASKKDKASRAQGQPAPDAKPRAVPGQPPPDARSRSAQDQPAPDGRSRSAQDQSRPEAKPRSGAAQAPSEAKPRSDAKSRSAPASTREPAAGPDSRRSASARPASASSAKAAASSARQAAAATATTVAYASAAAKAAAAEHEHIHSQADAESFALYMAGVRALEDKATRIPRSASRIERAAKGALPTIDTDAPARAELQALVAEGIRFETSDDGERIEGRRIEVEPREVRRLRRGQYTVDQQLDLHGLTTHDARKSLEAFVEKRRKEGDRVVRIIHGKGAHSPRGLSVLRGEIAAWLSEGPAKRHIAAFATAPPEEGGAGALLVLLMRRS